MLMEGNSFVDNPDLSGAFQDVLIMSEQSPGSASASSLADKAS